MFWKFWKKQESKDTIDDFDDLVFTWVECVVCGHRRTDGGNMPLSFIICGSNTWRDAWR